MKNQMVVIVFLSVLFLAAIAVAGPIDTGFITWAQPNGSTFTARCWGDEIELWMETDTGYRIVQAADGWFYYATLNGSGDYTATSSKVGIDSPPPANSYKLERTLACENIFEARRTEAEDSIGAARIWFKQKQAAAGSNPVVLKVGVIMVEFSDSSHYVDTRLKPTRPFGYFKSDFDSMIFSRNYWNTALRHPEGDNLYGSMRDYYDVVSRGKLQITGSVLNPADSNGVPVWLRIGPKDSPDYKKNVPGMKDTVLAAYNIKRMNDSLHWPSLASYDRLIFIHAGAEKPFDNITHAGDCHFIQVPERAGIERVGPTNITFAHMGLYAHEFGHDIGFYDQYINQKDESTNIYNFDLMANGLYNGPQRKGECPATMVCIERIAYNWVTPQIWIHDTSNVRITYNFSNPRIVRINPLTNTDSSECFYLEVKLRQGYDTFIPTQLDSFGIQPGILLIWHANARNNLGMDPCNLVFADNSSHKLSQLTDFFPLDSLSNSQSINDTTAPGFTIGWKLYEANSEAPAHIAFHGIHRHKPQNQNDSDYTVIDSIFTKRVYARGRISAADTWGGTVKIIGNDTVLSTGSLTVNSGTQIQFSSAYSLVVSGTVTINGAPTFSGTGSIKVLAGGTLIVGASVNLTLPTSVTLSLQPGSQVKFGTSSALTANSPLDAQGTSGQNIVFTTTGTPGLGRWDKIALNSSPNTLAYCLIKYANFGLYIMNSSSNSVSNCVIDSCQNYGIYEYNSTCAVSYTTVKNCNQGILGSSGSLGIASSTIQNNRQNGVYNSGATLHLGSANYIQNNTQRGVYIAGAASTSYFGDSYQNPGCNILSNNGYGEVYVASGSGMVMIGDTVLGVGAAMHCGYNKLTNSLTSNGHLVNNLSALTVYAERNYWGGAGVVNAIAGSVDTVFSFYSSPSCPMGQMAVKKDDPRNLREAASTHRGPAATVAFDLGTIARNIPLWKLQVARGGKDAVKYLYLLSSYVMSDPSITWAFGENWEEYLGRLADSASAQNVRELAQVQGVQLRIANREYGRANGLIDRLLAGNISTLFRAYLLESKFHNLLVQNDPDGAEELYNQLSRFDTGIEPSELELLATELAVSRNLPIGNALSGKSTASQGATTQNDRKPDTYALDQNYPNPFNPSTVIRYQIPENAKVRLIIYDILGREVETLVNADQPAGRYSVQLNASRYASGVYFYSINAGKFNDVKKLLLAK